MPKIVTYPSGLRLAGLGSVLEAGLGIGVSAPYKNNNNIHL